MATWWDYGYASIFLNTMPTFHDGGAQNTPSTHFVATAFLDADQASSVGNLKFLGTQGHKGIAAQPDLASLSKQFDAALDALSRPLCRRHRTDGWLDQCDFTDWQLGYRDRHTNYTAWEQYRPADLLRNLELPPGRLSKTAGVPARHLTSNRA